MIQPDVPQFMLSCFSLRFRAQTGVYDYDKIIAHFDRNAPDFPGQFCTSHEYLRQLPVTSFPQEGLYDFYGLLDVLFFCSLCERKKHTHLWPVFQFIQILCKLLVLVDEGLFFLISIPDELLNRNAKIVGNQDCPLSL